MNYRWYTIFMLIPWMVISMELARENKLILSMVQNNTCAYLRLSVLDMGCTLTIQKMRQKVSCAPLFPFFLAERLSQSLPAKPISLKRFYSLKNALVNQGFIKIEDVMEPENQVILVVRQECVYVPRKTYSLFVALYDKNMNIIRTICNEQNEPLKSNSLSTYFNVVINTQRLEEIELEATPNH